MTSIQPRESGESPVELNVFTHKNGGVVTSELFKHRSAAELSGALFHVEDRGPKLPSQEIESHPLPLQLTPLNSHRPAKAIFIFHRGLNLLKERIRNKRVRINENQNLAIRVRRPSVSYSSH